VPWALVGWVEIRRTTPVGSWRGVIDLGPLIDYDWAAASLFGAPDERDEQNIGFTPVAKGRGLPPDLSVNVLQTLQGFENATSYASWITWQEVADHFDDISETPGGWPHVYNRMADGRLEFEQVLTYWSPDLANAARLDYSPAEDPWPSTDLLGYQWESGHSVYRIEPVWRRELFGIGWQLLFELIQLLVRAVSPDGVRLVIWLVR
jgi:hypothetical protein